MHTYVAIHVIYSYLHISIQNAEFIIDKAYEEYLNEALKGDNAHPVDVSEKMQNLIKNKQNFSATPLGPYFISIL